MDDSRGAGLELRGGKLLRPWEREASVPPLLAKPAAKPVTITSPSADYYREQARQPVKPTTITSPSADYYRQRVQQVAKPAKPVMMPAESFGTARALTDYEYKVSTPELQRLRENNPKAADTIRTEVTSAVPLTWEAYDALSSEQKAAVDFNTLLVNAREADLLYKGSFTPKFREQYDKDVKELFGSQGGSDVIAPETVALLKKINFKAVGQDLDEFLSLERVIDTTELPNFSFSEDEVKSLAEFEATPEVVTTGVTETGARLPPAVTRNLKTVDANRSWEGYADVRTPENLAAIDTALIEGALKAYKDRLAAFQGAPWSIEASLGMLDEFHPTQIPAGYGRGAPGSPELKMDKALEDAYNMLRANPNDAGLEAIYADFTDRNWTPEEQEMLWTYVDDRSRRELQYMDDKDAQMVRDILGWK